MKLYYGKGSCSVVIGMIINAMHQRDAFSYTRVDLKTKLTEEGENYLLINPRGAVPAIQLDNQEVLTESAVIQQYLADQYGAVDLLPPVGDFRRYRVLESLNWVITEVHKGLTPLFNGNVPDEIKARAFKTVLESKLGSADQTLVGKQYLVLDRFTLPDANLFYALTCLPHVGIDIQQWPNLTRYFKEIATLPHVSQALADEGLEAGVNDYIASRAQSQQKMERKMKIFVTGGAGYIGNAVVKALSKSGHEVIALVRSAEKAAEVEKHGAKAHIGNLADPETYAGVAQQVDAIVHTVSLAFDKIENATVIDRRAIDTLLAASEKGGRRFIYTSGSWVCGDHGATPIDEDTAVSPPDFLRWRPAAEQAVLSAVGRGIASLIIRPGPVYGGNGGLFAKFILGEPGVVRLVGDGENHWSPVNLDDLADLYVRAVEKVSVSGEHLVNAADEHPDTFGKICAALAGASQRTIRKLSTEEASEALGVIGGGFSMSQNLLSSRARATFGWAPRHHSIVESAAEVVAQASTAAAPTCR